MHAKTRWLAIRSCDPLGGDKMMLPIRADESTGERFDLALDQFADGTFSVMRDAP